MTERELQAVAEAIGFIIGNTQINDGRTPDYEDIAEAAISASDSKYVKGLVEALKDTRQEVYAACVLADSYKEQNIMFKAIWDKTRPTLDNIDKALQNLPEDLRK